MTLTCADYIAQRVRDTGVFLLPKPCLYAERFLPDSVYEDVVDAVLRTAFQPVRHPPDPTRSHGAHHLREQFIVPRDINLVADDVATVWRDLLEALSSAVVRSALLDRLGAGLAGATSASPVLMISRHHPGYFLGPHTDSKGKLLTCIINVPERPGLDHLGTRMYVPRDANFTCNGDRHHPFEPFVEAGIAPYRPNSALIFARDDSMFHGVPTLSATELQSSARVNVQFNLWNE